MNNIEALVKSYSSKKLKEIVEQQSSSYSETFIDYAKDELIKRGESFEFNPVLEKEIAEMNDRDLKNLVEKEWNNFHLEYVEIARAEYLKRNFKNEASGNPEEKQKTDTQKRYPALSTIAGIYSVFAWIIGIVAVIMAIYLGNGLGSGMVIIATLIGGFLIVLGLLAASESIKLFIDIEENTRRTNE